MELRRSALIHKVSGSYARHYVIRTRRDGSVVIARKASHMGKEEDSPAIRFARECWTLLDKAWWTLTPEQRIEWARCPPRIRRDGRMTGFLHFKTYGLRRMIAGMPALASPPDRFQAHLEYFVF
jgi:hypothetical protein